MPYAMQITRAGPPDVLQRVEIAIGEPGPGQIRIAQTMVGMNFADLLHRSGDTPLPLPAVPGLDGVGHIIAVGEGVADLSLGDRVVYTMQLGAYAQERLLPAVHAVKVPEGISNETAAALFSKGLTARYLIKEAYRVTAEDTILVHAAAGGVGSLLARWANALGATVIGTVSSDAKAAFARESGCHHVIVTASENFVERVSDITAGAKLPVVYDSIGRDTFDGSLDCLRPRGRLVSYGRASGPVENVSLDMLGRRGSLMVTQTGLLTFIAGRERLLTAAGDLFDAILSGILATGPIETFPLAAVPDVHRMMESRQLTGSVALKI